MTSITAITLDVADTAAAADFYAHAFGLKDQVRFRSTSAPTSGFRGFTASLVVAGPGTVDSFIATALEAGATTLKAATKSLWGYGGVVQVPDGSIWKVASSSKKDSGPVRREFDQLVVLLGVENVGESKRFYIERGLKVGKGFGPMYVEFDTTPSPIKLALYKRKALAKDAGVPAEGSGSHRLTFVGELGTFTDPDGFEWEAAAD